MSSPELPPIYAGPKLPRWQPRTLEEVQAAFADGTLGENHWVDAKRELQATRGDRKEQARDLASFSVDGGCLVVGVDEDKDTQTFTVKPVPLAGLAEAIDQVARTRCDPPLFVTCRPIPDPADPSRGVLLIEIPPSPLAPHMVDGAYWGRGDTTKHKLTDAEVERLHAVRRARQLTAEEMIDAEIARDPTPAQMREHAHLFIVARPLSARADLLTEAISGRELNDLVRTLPQPRFTQASPPWSYLASDEPRARGWGWRSFGFDSRVPNVAVPDVKEEGLLDLELADDGTITFFTGGASWTPPRTEREHLLDAAVITLTRNVVTLAGQIGVSYGYNGRWLIAVGLTNIKGVPSGHALHMSLSSHPPFSEDRYVHGTEVATAELVEQPGKVTGDLLFRLQRALNILGAYETLLQ